MRGLFTRWLERARRSPLVKRLTGWLAAAGDVAASYHDPFSGSPPTR